jgi:hypothetical protein
MSITQTLSNPAVATQTENQPMAAIPSGFWKKLGIAIWKTLESHGRMRAAHAVKHGCYY